MIGGILYVRALTITTDSLITPFYIEHKYDYLCSTNQQNDSSRLDE